jgi:hypothetical protein
MSKILTLAGASEGLGRRPATKKTKKPGVTAHLKPGECMCILNTRRNKGTKLCKTGKTRSGIQISGDCPNPIKTK